MFGPRARTRGLVLWAALLLLLGFTAAFALSALAQPASAGNTGPVAGVPAQATPAATGTAPTGGRLEGTVAAVSTGSITLNLPSGKLQTITLPPNVPVVRDGKVAGIDAVQATDRVVVQGGAANVRGLLVFSVAPTAVPTAQATATAGPAPTPSETVVTGTVSAVNGTKLTIAADDATTPTIDTANARNLKVTLNDQTATAADIKTGDSVMVVLGSDKRPVQIAATSFQDTAPTGLSWKWVPYALGFMVPFLLLLLPLVRRKRIPFVVRHREP